MCNLYLRRCRCGGRGGAPRGLWIGLGLCRCWLLLWRQRRVDRRPRVFCCGRVLLIQWISLQEQGWSVHKMVRWALQVRWRWTSATSVTHEHMMYTQPCRGERTHACDVRAETGFWRPCGWWRLHTPSCRQVGRCGLCCQVVFQRQNTRCRRALCCG